MQPNRRTVWNITLQAAFTVALLMLCTVVYAQIQDRRAVEVSSINVFPGAIESTGWENVDAILNQNLDGDALYQDFNTINSAYVPADVSLDRVPVRRVQSDGATAPEATATSSATTTATTSGATTTEPVAVQPVATTTPDTVDAEPVIATSSETAVTEPETTATTTPEADVVDMDASAASTTGSTTVLRRMQRGFQLAYTKMIDVFPFAQSATSTDTSAEQSDDADSETEAEAEESEVVVETPVATTTESANDTDSTEPSATTTPVATTTVEQATTTATTTNDTNEEDATTTPEVVTPPTEPEAVEDIDEPEATTTTERDEDAPSLQLTLRDFGLPVLDADTRITGGQLRVSMAAQKRDTRLERPAAFVVEYSLDNGATWEDGGGVTVDDEISNSINGDYFLFALPTITEADELESLAVRITYQGERMTLEELYIDAAWLEVFTETGQLEAEDPLASFDDNFSNAVLEGDELVLPNGERITFSFTDDNEGEDLIIKSDDVRYNGLSEATMYFNITNTSKHTDSFNVKTYFPKNVGTVTSLQVWNQNRPREVVIPEYRPFVYHCAGGWGDVPEETEPELSFDTPTTNEATNTATTTSNTTPDTASTTDITAESVSEPVSSTTASTSSTTVQHTIDSVQTFAQAATTTSTRSTTTVETEVEQSGANEYYCASTVSVQTCDAVSEDGTECQIEKRRVAEHKKTAYQSGWETEQFSTTTENTNTGRLARLSGLLGVGPAVKPVPEEFAARTETPDVYTIQPGETRYFKMEISFPPFSQGEFWIEAVGNKTYGLLDPFWSSLWEYRMPIEIDNTANSQALDEDQVFLELDSSLTDFWSNVNSDGSDVRFVYEEPGNVDEWFGISQPDTDWYDRDWQARMPFTIQSSQVGSTLVDFPVYVDLGTLGTDFFAAVQDDGDDIRVTLADGQTEVPFEIVAIDTGSEAGEMYFKADTISASTDTTFYIYYDNDAVSGYADAATYGAENVWSDNYEAVYHLSDYSDSTSNGRNGTAIGTPTQTSGLYDLDGNTDMIQLPSNFGIFSGADSFTWQVRFEADAVAPDTNYVTSPVLLSMSGENNTFFTFGDGEPGDTMGFRYEGWTTPVTATGIATGVDYRLTMSYDEPGADMRMYLNGSETDSSAGTISIAAGTFGANYIGGNDSGDPNRAFDGRVDEVRILSAPLTAGWVAAEDTNMTAPTSFYATSTAEAPPALEEIGEWSYRTAITIQSAQVPAALTDFPVYVDLSDLGDDFFDNVQDAGGDIRITEVDGKTELPYELVDIDTSAKTGQLHFKANSISDVSDTTFYVYYGNVDAPAHAPGDTYGADNVWPSQYEAVYHLEEDASGRGNDGLYQDSTTNNYDADDELVSTGKTGFLGRGQEIRSRSTSPYEYLLFPSDTINGKDQFTASFWVNTTQTSNQALLNAGANNDYLLFLQNNNITLYDGTANDTITDFDTPIVNNGWRYVTIARDAIGEQWRVFVNGNEESDSPLAETMDPISVPADCFMMGGEQDGTCLSSGDLSQHFSGLVDEIVFRTTVPSEDVLTAEFNNQSDTSAFYATSSAEALRPTTHTELDFWLQHFDATAEEADVWLQVDSVPANSTSTIYLYYGSAGATSASDEYAPFTYSSPRELYYTVNGDDTGPITVYSLIDDNEVSIDGGSSTILQSGETTSFATYSSSSVVSASGPITSRTTYDSGEPLIPISFATTTHMVASTRGNENYFVHAPLAAASVSTYNGDAGSPTETATVSLGSTREFSALNNNNAAIIESDEPILVYHNTPDDSLVAYPPTTRDLFGIRSQQYHYAALADGTSVDTYCSDGTNGTAGPFNRGANQSNDFCTAGGDGTGNAVRLTNQTSPVTAIQQADSDGTESSVFLPELELGTRYIVPQGAEYISVVCTPRFGTSTLQVQNAVGVTIDTGVCNAGGEYPGAFNFTPGSAYPQGSQIVSTNDVPFYMYYEFDGGNGGEETNSWSAVQARTFIPNAVGTTFGAQEVANDAQYEQLNYRWYEEVDAQTPTTPRAAEDTALIDALSINAGEVLRLRMNIRANNATGTISSEAFRLQYAEAETCSAATSWSDVGKVGSTTAAFSGYNNASVTDGSNINTLLLSQSTVAGTYEEENLTSYIQTEIAVGEIAEWDWSIQAIDPNSNSNYCFRMVRDDGTAIATYSGYPQLTTAGPPLEPQLQVYFDNERTPDSAPVLEFAAEDTTGDEVHYQVQIDDDIDFSSTVVDRNSIANFLDFENVNNPSDKAPFGSGARVRFTSGTSVSDTTTYWWRTRARDPSGSDEWGEWSTARSFTTNSATVISEWYQTTGEQFSTNELTSVSTSTGAVAVSGVSGVMRSTAIDFDDATVGNAWGELFWNDTETSGTITYQVEYLDGATWSLIPNTVLSGNSAGFTSSPVNLLSLSTDTYNTIRLVATFSGSTLSLQDWGVRWGERVDTPTLITPFDHEKVSTTTPTFTFTATDPESDDLEYEVSYSADNTFVSSTTITTGTYTSGATGVYAIPSGSPLSNGQTYWWRARAKDPSGGDAWSPWSAADSFTVDTTVSVSTWFQTTQEQFQTGTLAGAEATLSDQVEVSSRIGEYGTVTVTDDVWTTVNTNRSYSDMVVVGSPEYASNGSTDGRTVRVRNKTADSFEILVDNYDASLSASISVDYMVMESGTWEVEMDGSSVQVIAGTAEAVSLVKNKPYSSTAGTQVVFSPTFATAPAVLATVSSENDASWVGTAVDNGSGAGNEVGTDDMYLSLGRSTETIFHDPEDIDYIAFEPADGANDGVEFRAFNSNGNVNCCNNGTAVNYPSAFGSTPAVTVVHNNANSGSDGGFAVRDTTTAATNNTAYLEVIEVGPESGTHAGEVVSVVAFEDASGFIVRDTSVGGDLSGTLYSEAIAFSDGTGPKFEQAYWSDTTPGASTIRYQVEYQNSNDEWELIPNVDLPGNSVGTSSSPIDLSTVDVLTYDTIRLVAQLECDASDCPSLQDWSIEWSEGVVMSGTLQESDRITNVASGTIAVAVNGTLLPTTGAVTSGIWSVNNITAFTGDTVTVFVDGAEDEREAVAAFIYDGTGDMTDVALYERHLSFSANEKATTTNALLSAYDYSVSGNEDIFFDVDGNNDLTTCAVGACLQNSLFIGGGNAYQPDETDSGNVETHDVINNGTLLPDGNTVRVSGVWENNANFVPAASTVMFTATTTNYENGTWYDTDWAYRVPITIEATAVDAPLNDFPVYVDLSDLPSSFFTNVQVDGDDIRVTVADQVTEVPFELVAINTGAETGELHFKAPTLSDATDTVFYVYYGNGGASPYAAADTFGRNNVWTNSYQAVYHLEDGDSTASDFYTDATGNGFDGTLIDGNGNSGTNSGQLGQGYDFNGDADYIDTFTDASGFSINGANQKSISAWTYTEGYNDGGPFSLGTRTDGQDYTLRTLGGVNTWRVQHWGGPDHDFSYTSQNQWVHFVLDYDGSTSRLYADGAVVSSEVAALNTTDTFDLRIGSWHDTNYFNGRIDEVRVATTTRTSQWYDAEHTNQRTPATFYTIGAQSDIPQTPTAWTLDDAAGTLTFNNLTFGETASAATWEPLDPLDVNGILSTQQGTFDRSTTTVNVAGNLIVGADGAWSGVGTTTFDGTVARTWTDSSAGGQNIGNVVIDGTSKTVTVVSDVLASTITIGANDTLNGGTSNDISLLGDFTNNNLFLPQTSRLVIVGNGTDATIQTNGSNLYQLRASSTAGMVTFADATVTLLDNLEIATGTVTLPPTLLRVGGSFLNTGGTFAHNNSLVSFTGNGAESIALLGTAFLNGFNDVRFNGAGNYTFTDTNATTTGSFTINNGSVTFPSGQLTVGREFLTTAPGSFAANGGEVLFLTRSTDSITTNGSAFNDVRFREGTPVRGGDFDAAWLYRDVIVIDANEVDAELTDFPVYLDLADFDPTFFSAVRADGGDIRVTEADGVTEVPREIVAIDTGSETGEMYFKAPTLSSTTNTTFYVYYGNPAATDYAVTATSGAQNVWDDDFLAVYHMNEINAEDSTSFNRDGTASGDTLTTAPGQVGTAVSISDNGGSDYINLNSNLTELNNLAEMTVSAWVNINDNSNDDVIFTRELTTNDTPILLWDNVGGTTNNDTYTFNVGDTGTNNRVDAAPTGISENNTWQYVTGSMQGANRYIYVDGLLRNTQTNGVTSIPVNTLGSGIGYWGGSTAFDYNGLIDEYRISRTERSPAWIAAEFRNTASSTDFYSVTSGGVGSASRIFADTTATVGGDLVIESGRVQFPSTNLYVGGSFDNDDTFQAGSGAVTFTAGTTGHTIAAGTSSFATLAINGAGGGWTVTEHATATTAINLLAGDTFVVDSGLTLESTGTFYNNMSNASTTWTGATLKLSSDTNFTINDKLHEGDTYNTLVLTGDTDIAMWNSSASSYQTQDTSSVYSQDHLAADGDLYIFGDYNRTSGTEYWSYATDFDGSDLSGGSERAVAVQVENGGGVTIENASLQAVGDTNASTTVDAQSGNYEWILSNATVTAENLAVAGGDTAGMQLRGSTTISSFVNSVFTIPTVSAAITVSSTTIDTNPAAQYFGIDFVSGGGNTNVNLLGTPSSFWWFRDGSGDRYGEAYDNGDGNPGAVRWDDSSYQIDISGVVYADNGNTPLGGPTCDGSTATVRVVVDGGAYTDAVSCDGVTGAFNFSNVSYIGDPVIHVYLDTAGGTHGAVVTKTPTANITDLDLYANRVITRHEDTVPLTIADMAVYDVTDDADIPYTAATSGTPTLTTHSNTALYIYDDTEFAPEGPVVLEANATANDYDGTLYIGAGATFTATGTTLYTVGGSLLAENGATLTTASSTFLFNATSTGKEINASSTLVFNELDFDGSGGSWSLNSAATAATDVDINAGTLTGSGDLTLLDGSLSGNGVVDMIGGTVTLNQDNTLGGTTPWNFYNLTLGDGGVAGVTTPASLATTTVRNIFTIAAGHFYDAGASVLNLAGSGTVFVETGTFLEDTSTVQYSGATPTIRRTAYYDLLIDDESTSVAAIAPTTGLQVLNDLTVGVAGTASLDITTNDPLTSVAGDFTIGTGGTVFASNSANLQTFGDWQNDGTFTANGGTVVFASPDAAVIDAGDSAFANVSFTAVGPYSMIAHATATENFSLAALAGYTQQSGTTLAVGGQFTNATDGIATTWAGSTLYLYGGQAYQINGKTKKDTYASVVIGDNTHPRLWNSTFGSVLTGTEASLYAMDHADVAGDLYIYGDYVNSSFADVWSYTRDFDGAVGSNRQANVFVEGGGSVRYTGGSLAVQGSSSASTTVQSFGGGTYDATIGGSASTTWQYVVPRDVSAAGITFTGTPEVHDFSYLDLLVELNGATAVTVDGSVIDANPAQNFTNDFFNFDTGVTGATNVTASGTSISSWRFTNHSGNLDGEANDNDGGDPGEIVWEDSALEITVSGTVYSDEGSTVSGVCDGVTNNIVLRVAGLTTYSGSCDGGTGAYSIPNVAFSANDTLTLYIDGEAVQAANVSVDPISNVSNMDLYENRVIVRHEGSDPITIADMAVWDSADDADIPFTAVNSAPDTVALPANTKLIVWNNKEFAPGGNVTVAGGGAGDAVDGTFEVFPGATFTAAGNESHEINGSFIFDTGAVFNSASSTITLSSTASGRIVDTNEDAFHHLTFSGTGAWTVSDATMVINGDMSKSGGAVTLPSGTTTVSGDFDNSGGTFDANGGALHLLAADGGNTLRLNGSSLQELQIAGGGSYAMVDATATALGSVRVSDGTLALPGGTFTVGGSVTVGTTSTLIHNSGTLTLTSTTTEIVTLNGSDLFNLTINGAGDVTMTDATVALRGSLTVATGTLHTASNTLSIAGSLDATGGILDTASSTLLFDSTDVGEVIDVGANELYNVVISGASGGWTFASATTTNDFSITAASAFTLGSGEQLYVGGVFANAIGGAATTWTGSTLTLAGGVPYSVSDKTAGTEVYGNVQLLNNTDVQFWNSSFATTSLSASSSIYSQDHAGVNGALHIAGDYEIAGSGEYWSYATDFDGTTLSGGARRAVSVTFDDTTNAGLRMGAGSLEVIGVAGATTTITALSDGQHNMSVAGGSFEAAYYSFDQLDEDGLLLRGTSSILGLNNGHFTQGVDIGKLISLEQATLNANAGLLIENVRFDNGGYVPGNNVVLSATSTNAWQFRNHTGTLDGEDYDIDGLTNCGSIRWDDSDCQLLEQTSYRWRNDDGGLGVPSSDWFDSDWGKRQRVRLENDVNTTVSSTSVEITVQYNANMQSDFDDLRFTDATGINEIPFWIEKRVNADSAQVWLFVEELPARDIATFFMYYDNVAASDASNPTAVFTAVDDFEDGDISEYSGDSFYEAGVDIVYAGTYAAAPQSGSEGSRATDGIARFDQTVSQGETIRYRQYIDTGTGSDDEACTLFAVQSPITLNQNYGICLEQFGTDRMVLAKDVESTDTYGSVSILSSTNVTYTTGWYEVVVNWKTDNTIDTALYNPSGTLVATTSASDSSYTSGGFGFTSWGQNGAWDSFASYSLIETAPTVRFGFEQTEGGASWNADTNTAASNIAIGSPLRLRFALENSGLDLTAQQYQLEAAAKGGAPTCEAVSGASFSAVAPAGSCGGDAMCMASTTNYANYDSTTDLLLGAAGDFVAGEAIEDPVNQTTSFDFTSTTYTEIEYAITPTMNVSDEAYCFRVTNAGSELDAYAVMPEMTLEFTPIVDTVSFNGGNTVTLAIGTTTEVTATATVTDLNGFADIAAATTTFYKSDVAGLADCTPDNNNCYRTTLGEGCSLAGCAGSDCTLSCTVDFAFHTDPTDVDGGVFWYAYMEVGDSTDNTDFNTSVANDVGTLRALGVEDSINYGSLGVNTNTGGYNASTTIVNLGNEAIDVNVLGTDLSDGAASVIDANEQVFATSTFTYGACAYCTQLSEIGSVVELDLAKPTASTPPISDELYWGINIPFGTNSVEHTGINSFIATGD